MKSPRPASSAPAAAGAFTLSPRWTCVLIFLVALAAYLPTLGAGFIWDDQPGHVTRPELQSLDGLARIWSDPSASQQYYPLLHFAFWVEHQLWGDAPFGYHLLNILLHATAACLFAALLRYLAVPGAAFAALLFSLHPICVETVAWVSEQKNTLSLVLYLCAALAYLRFDVTRRTLFYALASALFLAALLTKTVTATLPAALLVILWWQRGRLTLRRDVLPVLPWFVASIFAALITTSTESGLIGAEGSDFAISSVQRILLASRAVWFYFAKLVFPFNLSFVYPRVLPDASDALPWLLFLGGIALLAFLVWSARRSRAPLAAALLFVGGLFPALGFINVFPFLFSFVADHFQYLPSLALFALAGAGLMRLTATARLTTIVAVSLLFFVLTFQQSRIYHDDTTLFEATVTRNPTAWMAHNNLGNALVEAGRSEEAIPNFEQAIKLHANYAEGENNLGGALNELRRYAEAIPHLKRAVALNYGYADAHNTLGVSLMSTGHTAEGIIQFIVAKDLNPANAVTHRNLGLAYAQSNRTAEALPYFARAIALRPDYPEAQTEWGTALTLAGRFAEAWPHYEAALRITPDAPDIHVTYGRSLDAGGRPEEAIAHFQKALALAPDQAEAHYQYALILRRLGRLEEATRHYNEAQRLGAGRRP